MQDGSLEQLLLTQMQDVQDEHPDLGLFELPDGKVVVQGTVHFHRDWEGKEVSGEYQIEIEVPKEYPDAVPSVRETGGVIPKGFHRISATGCLCLGAPVEVNKKFADHKTLLGFIDNEVIPYLFSHSYFTEHGEMPWGGLAHGMKGILEHYTDYFATDDLTTLKLLKILADGTYRGFMFCPCGSQKEISACHGPRLQELAPVQSSGEFATDLRNLTGFLKSKGQRLPEREVAPKKTLRRRNRKRRKKRT